MLVQGTLNFIFLVQGQRILIAWKFWWNISNLSNHTFSRQWSFLKKWTDPISRRFILLPFYNLWRNQLFGFSGEICVQNVLHCVQYSLWLRSMLVFLTELPRVSWIMILAYAPICSLGQMWLNSVKQALSGFHDINAFYLVLSWAGW